MAGSEKTEETGDHVWVLDGESPGQGEFADPSS